MMVVTQKRIKTSMALSRERRGGCCLGSIMVEELLCMSFMCQVNYTFILREADIANPDVEQTGNNYWFGARQKVKVAMWGPLARRWGRK